MAQLDEDLLELRENQEDNIVARVSLVRGVMLNLTWDMRLVSATISPTKVQERRSALRFVGIAKDSSYDVAQRHDNYLVEAGSHATS